MGYNKLLLFFPVEALVALKAKKKTVVKKKKTLKKQANKPAKGKDAPLKKAHGRASRREGPTLIGLGRPSLPLIGQRAADRLSVLTVEPGRIFVHWELTEKKGFPAMRLYDAASKKRVFEIMLRDREGSAYIKLEPGMKFRVRTGVMDKNGRFELKKSAAASTPPAPARVRVPARRKKTFLPPEYYEFSFIGSSR